MSGAFRFAYNPPTIRCGPGSVAHLDTELARVDCTRPLVVCGQTVGERPAVLDPVRDGLGTRCAGVFAETTPAKRLATAVACAERMDECDADGIVALGSGSSIDVARVAGVVAASEHSPAALGDQLAATGTLSVPDETVPIVAVPTTLAGASLSALAGVSATPDAGPVSAPAGGGVGAAQLMPAAAVYDPVLVAETPRDVLAGSAMNGLSKGIETLYASTRTPVTDATASRGLELLADSLPTLGPNRTADGESEASERDPNLGGVVQGLVLVQYGASRPDGTTFSVLHALGHALRVHSRDRQTGAGVQLGRAHAAVAPAALSWLFEQVDGRRDLLARALGAETAAPARGVVERVRELRCALGLPERLRALAGLDRDVLEDVATTAADSFLGTSGAPGPAPDSTPRATVGGWRGTPHPPPELDVSAPALRAVLETAW
jgi:alcohol dehydrogenase class IV